MAGSMHDSWKTGTGLPEDIDITITDCRWEFGEAPKNNDGTLGDEPCRTVFVYEDEDNEEGEIFLNCGKGWEPGPKGESVVRDDGKKKGKFNNRSAFGFWLNHAADLKGVSEAIGSLDTTKKATWVGTKWHIQREDETFRIRGGEEITRSSLYPDAYNGRVGDKVKGKGGSASTSAATSKAAPKSAPVEDDTEEGVDNTEPSGKLLARLKELAAEHDSHEDWAAAALEDDVVSGNDDYTAWVMLEDNYTGLREE